MRRRARCPGTCQINHTPTATKHPRCVRDNQLRNRFPLLERNRLPPSSPLCLRSADWPPAGAPCSICYNKSTILASTRDDSIERSGLAWPFSENHASLSLHVSSTMHQSSSRRPRHVTHTLSPLVPAASPYSAILLTDDHSWLKTTVNLRVRGGTTIPSERLCSTALLPSSEIELARNGSGSWSRGASRSFFQAHR